MAVVQADFRQVAKLVQVAHRFGREEVKYGLGCKGGMLESWKNPTLVFKRPIKGVCRQRENSQGRNVAIMKPQSENIARGGTLLHYGSA